MTESSKTSARYVDRSGMKSGSPYGIQTEPQSSGSQRPPLKLGRPDKSLDKSHLLDGLSSEQIFAGLILESNFGKDFNFAHLLDKLLELTKIASRMSDYSMVVRCQKQIRDIVFEQTGEERFTNLQAKMKEFAPQLQALIADMVAKKQIDLDTL